jgi:hypothetical protein
MDMERRVTSLPDEHEHDLLESRMTRKCQVRFGGGAREQEPCYLACVLPYQTGWKIDGDRVKDPRPDMSLFYCLPCGKYVSVNIREGVS